MTSIDVEKVVPILYFDRGLFNFCRAVFQCFQCLVDVLILIHPQTFFSDSPLKYNTHFSFIVFIHYHPQNSPNIDVVTIDTFIDVDHNIEDAEKHHILYQVYKHNHE